MNLEQAQQAFLDLRERIDDASKMEFMSWLESAFFIPECSGELPAIAHSKMCEIAQFIRGLVPLEAVVPSEKITPPTDGENADCDPSTTVHVDAFLYEEPDIDDLVNEGKLSRNYCKACKSQDVAPLTFISHSASSDRVSLIYRDLLPHLEGKSVLDVGSRLGPILYGAYIYTPANPIIGVEKNAELCAIQEKAIENFKMTDRIKILHADICDRPNEVSSSDVVILHNVFEFFIPKKEQIRAWQFLHKTIKKGAILVTVPTLEMSLSNLSTGIDISKWVKKRHVTDYLTYSYMKSTDELSEICTYEVL